MELQDYIRKVAQHDPLMVVLSKVKQVHSREPIKLGCRSCGENWTTRYACNGYTGFRQCECAREQRNHKPLRQTHEDFVAKIRALRSDIVVLSKFTGIKATIQVKSLVCGHAFDSTPDRLLHSSYYTRGCSACSAQRDFKGDLKWFKRELRKRHQHIKAVGEYKGTGQCIDLHCTKCDHTYSQRPVETLGKRKLSCPMCAIHHTGYARKHVRLGRRTFTVQGYEPQFLRGLHKNNPKVFAEIKSGREVPRFKYRDGDATRTYLPDFFVPSTNTIVEIKSDYVLVGKEEWFKNLLKKRASVIRAGYNFKLMAFDRHETLIKLPDDWWKMKWSKLRLHIRQSVL